MPSILYGTKNIEFKVLRKPRMKNTYIQITANGVVVKTNKTISMREINSFVTKKSAWILKHLDNFKAKKVDEKIKTGSAIYYLGKSYLLELKENQNLKNPSLEFRNSKFIIEAQKDVSQEELLWVIDKFYKEKAMESISPLVEKWSSKMSLVPTYVGYRKAKTRWGSCSSVDRISLNYYLLKLPIHCIEYVVVHELAHIEHKNHSKNFWALVLKYLGDYKEREKEIKAYEKVII